MPKSSRALTRSARARANAEAIPYTKAREFELAIRERMDGLGETYEEAAAWLADPLNETLCEVCGWTVGMVCPECVQGCGCSRSCSGWRHREFMHEDELRELEEEEREANRCVECGADTSLGSYDECACQP